VVSRSFVRTILLLVVGAVIAACGRPAHLPLHDVTPGPTATPKPITLPADDVPHAEWVLYEDGTHVCNNIPFKYRPLVADWIRRQLGDTTNESEAS